MKEYEVNCVSRQNGTATHECITHIGHSGHQWRLSRESAILRIESKTEAFYTLDRATGRRAYIGVIREPGKPPYLRSYADGAWNDRLLGLGRCGVGGEALA